ncbi:PREDICTED: dual specificity protein phosphatase 18 [Nanorana parkeri]|uniref:dual specificity protein phosphatase 18 n=1 Tax=Nanorana parkeri TaxID=125878 RepID=UPI00085471D4|nr:PREDICTED: dual specificity protein phosphatase 18 [Nanorana parkeri]
MSTAISQRRPRAHHRFSKVTESLYLSNNKAAYNKTQLQAHGITCVINVSLEGPVGTPPVPEYFHFSVADIPETPLCDYFETVADKIHEVEANGGCTLVHCVAGISRSATLCLAYLMKHGANTLLEAHTHLKKCRPFIEPNIGFWGQLIAYELKLYGRNTVHLITSPIGIIPSVSEEKTKNMIPL